ncbi:hypothetical protein KUW00_15850 [Halomonas sp. DP5N14-9]|uniref:gas vesicle accessory protein GvpU n=1 Tax=Halomonas sp. DP5N14-9 TaxID=2859075 RepID=UPI001C994162|nr:gas vesicle accessory protein GvpU [Halomonas sp. DP5N14-9]MBY5942354.1 hypothetical protein [Halomonas sp. DP5N14-9]
MSKKMESNDFLLSMLVGMAESGASVGITISVNGTLVTGNLISQKKYVDELVSNLRAPLESVFPEHSNSMLESFSRIGNMSNGSSGTEGESGEYEYIHLGEAQHFVGNSAIPSDGVLWRGKLTAIDGFILGRISFERD